MPFDTDVLILRDNLVAAYKPMVACCRRLLTKEIESLPPRVILNFTRLHQTMDIFWLLENNGHNGENTIHKKIYLP